MWTPSAPRTQGALAKEAGVAAALAEREKGRK